MPFRYHRVTDADGLKYIERYDKEKPRLKKNNFIGIKDAQRVYLARTFAYVAAKVEGLVIVDITRPEKMKLFQTFTANGGLEDSRDVIVATTNATLFAYVADGRGGLKVVQLTAPDTQPRFYGFSPSPSPVLIASYPTRQPALSLSKGLERDRGVDETGGQIAIFGRLGSVPLNLEEMERLYLDKNRKPLFVTDKVDVQ